MSRARIALLTLLALLTFMLGILSYMPATVLQWLPTSAQIQYRGLQGSIWQGRVLQLQTPWLNLRNVSWQLSPWALLTGRAALDIEVPVDNPVSGQLSVALSLGQVTVEQADLSGDIAMVAAQLPLRLPLPVSGSWHLQVSEYQLEDWRNGAAVCDTLNARLQGEQLALQVNQQWQNLGNYQLQLSCRDDRALQLEMADNNPLGLTVSGFIKPPQIALQGHLQPTSDVPTAISDLLPYIGKPDAQGRYRFDVNFRMTR
ncbi:type II secretion system protein N [Idiomarina xiamenensis]|uniref:Type II secretion system protein N n=1 Tax=Idiomarina xiamenensis 10-D-4 TaxID=740709 RepID=K2L632_9GAMM|nr:type II secretion system protein N [Idiomarina xiamenensis]EKE85210.1 Type II secretory pathway, component PulN [Idiomarina xiamenensis 10-D-4]